MKNAVQHSSGNEIVAINEAKYFSRYSKAILVMGQPKPEDARLWNSLFMGWILNFKVTVFQAKNGKIYKKVENQIL